MKIRGFLRPVHATLAHAFAEAGFCLLNDVRRYTGTGSLDLIQISNHFGYYEWLERRITSHQLREFVASYHHVVYFVLLCCGIRKSLFCYFVGFDLKIIFYTLWMVERLTYASATSFLALLPGFRLNFSVFFQWVFWLLWTFQRLFWFLKYSYQFFLDFLQQPLCTRMTD